jgi:hypothetical protein
MNRNRVRLSLVLLVLVAAIGCAHAPPTLSPVGRTAFYNTRVIKGLDILRDFAVDANAQVPPLMSTDTTRKVVLYHRSALNVIHSTGNGWQPVVLTGLEEVARNLPTKEAQLIAPYVGLIKAIVAEVIQ